MATAAMDVPSLASYASVSESTISTLLLAPTVDLVQSFLTSILEKAHEHEQLKARSLRLDVELESVIRTSEAKMLHFFDCRTYQLHTPR